MRTTANAMSGADCTRRGCHNEEERQKEGNSTVHSTCSKFAPSFDFHRHSTSITMTKVQVFTLILFVLAISAGVDQPSNEASEQRKAAGSTAAAQVLQQRLINLISDLS